MGDHDTETPEPISAEDAAVQISADGASTSKPDASTVTAGAEGATAVVEAAGGGKPASDDRKGADREALDRDELFHLLKSERRRRALRYLLDADEETIIMRDVAEAVAAEEYDTTVAALGSDERQRVYITLYQSHLPQMADAGIITYDQSRGHITTTPLIEEFARYLHDGTTDDADTGSRVRMAVAGFGIGALLTLALLPVFGAVVTLAVTVLVIAAVVAIGIGIRREFPDIELPDGSSDE